MAKREVVVTGIGLISALGSLSTSWQRLLAGESAVKLRQPFGEISPLPMALIGETSAQLIPLTQLIVDAALEDSGLIAPLTDCGVVVGSSRGCQGVWEELMRGQPQDLSNWLNTLPHQAGIATAIKIGSQAQVLAPMAACATGIWAIARGWELLQMGECQRVIVGAVEAPITPLTLAGFEKMGALAKTGCYPFDRLREGLALGEGGAVLVLETAELARERKAKVYGQILGFGLTADGYHISAPNPNGSSGISAIKQCLHNSNLFPLDIDYIHAHGTSTQLNDRNEAKLIEKLFPPGVAVSSTKGATGHTLGASGAIGTAFSLLALQQQILPPCVGLKESEFALNVLTQPQQGHFQNALCFSFGFGGQNAVLAITRATPE
ncbi:MAG: beta-ketoacyl-ACP synthase [Spirulinaceae cyanobacterium]